MLLPLSTQQICHQGSLPSDSGVPKAHFCPPPTGRRPKGSADSTSSRFFCSFRLKWFIIGNNLYKGSNPSEKQSYGGYKDSPRISIAGKIRFVVSSSQSE